MANPESQVLIPVTEFEPIDLAVRFTEIVGANDNQALLTARYILGPLERYATVDIAETSIARAQDIHRGGIQEIFVVVGEDGDPEGIATIYSGLELKRLRLPIPLGLLDHPALAFLADKSHLISGLKDRRWWVDLDHANPNVTAWTGSSHEALLAKAYSELDERIDPQHTNTTLRPWTIEPRRSPRYIHEAIGATSMKATAKWRRFDDQETRHKVPPRSNLYARLHSEWYTSHGKQKELKDGVSSWLDDIEQKMATIRANQNPEA